MWGSAGQHHRDRADHLHLSPTHGLSLPLCQVICLLTNVQLDFEQFFQIIARNAKASSQRLLDKSSWSSLQNQLVHIFASKHFPDIGYNPVLWSFLGSFKRKAKTGKQTGVKATKRNLPLILLCYRWYNWWFWQIWFAGNHFLKAHLVHIYSWSKLLHLVCKKIYFEKFTSFTLTVDPHSWLRFARSRCRPAHLYHTDDFDPWLPWAGWFDFHHHEHHKDDFDCDCADSAGVSTSQSYNSANEELEFDLYDYRGSREW